MNIRKCKQNRNQAQAQASPNARIESASAHATEIRRQMFLCGSVLIKNRLLCTHSIEWNVPFTVQYTCRQNSNNNDDDDDGSQKHNNWKEQCLVCVCVRERCFHGVIIGHDKWANNNAHRAQESGNSVIFLYSPIDFSRALTHTQPK